MTTVRVFIEVDGKPLDYPLSVSVPGDPAEVVAAILRIAAGHIETGEIDLKWPMCMSPVATYSGSAPEMCTLEDGHDGRCRP